MPKPKTFRGGKDGADGRYIKEIKDLKADIVSNEIKHKNRISDKDSQLKLANQKIKALQTCLEQRPLVIGRSTKEKAGEKAANNLKHSLTEKFLEQVGETDIRNLLKENSDPTVIAVIAATARNQAASYHEQWQKQKLKCSKTCQKTSIDYDAIKKDDKAIYDELEKMKNKFHQMQEDSFDLQKQLQAKDAALCSYEKFVTTINYEIKKNFDIKKNQISFIGDHDNFQLLQHHVDPIIKTGSCSLKVSGAFFDLLRQPVSNSQSEATWKQKMDPEVEPTGKLSVTKKRYYKSVSTIDAQMEKLIMEDDQDKEMEDFEQFRQCRDKSKNSHYVTFGTEITYD